MNNNTPRHNPPGYTQVRDSFRPYQEATFRKCESGDFNGDGRTDLVRLDDRQIALYLAADRDVGPDDPMTGNPPRAVTAVLDPTWFNTDTLRNAAETRSWQTRSGDKHLVGDFDGDGADDLYVVNLTNWNKEYVGMLKSFDDRFEPVARYDDNLPGWEMGRNEEFHIGDFDGDGRDDIIAFDPDSWAQVHFRIYRSTGGALALLERWYGTVDVPGPNWQMRRRDKVYPLDFNADATTTLIAGGLR